MSLATIMPNYPAYDQDKSIEFTNRVTQALGGTDSSGAFQRPLKNIQDDVDRQAIPGHQQDQLSMIENLFFTKLMEYNSDTTSMVVLNDLANVNKFANDTADNETKRLSRLRTRTTSDLMKAKTEYLQLSYSIDYQRFQISVIQFTFFCIILLAMFVYIKQKDYISWWVFGTGAACIGIIYVIIIAFIYQNMLSRRKDDWNKYYFFTSKTKNA